MKQLSRLLLPALAIIILCTLDASAREDYGALLEQDCEVCCRPWQVQVRYDTTGSAEVMLEATE